MFESNNQFDKQWTKALFSTLQHWLAQSLKPLHRQTYISPVSPWVVTPLFSDRTCKSQTCINDALLQSMAFSFTHPWSLILFIKPSLPPPSDRYYNFTLHIYLMSCSWSAIVIFQDSVCSCFFKQVKMCPESVKFYRCECWWNLPLTSPRMESAQIRLRSDGLWSGLWPLR